jgi:hypothetical protein
MPRLSPKALAGKKLLEELQKESKRCTKGKSCGASCVNPQKDCEVSVPRKASQSLSKVSEEVTRKKRARCEENWAELIVAAVLENPSANGIEDILNSKVAGTETGYVNDLKKRRPELVSAYIQNFKSELKKAGISPNDVQKVYLLGKQQDKYPELEKLQQGLDRKEKKSDILVKMKNGSYAGFSVKASSGATLTNYAIEKLLPSFQEELKNTRLKMVKDAGLPDEFQKALRPKYNDLFRGGRNPYHNLLRKVVIDNKEEVLEKWTKGLFSKTPFPIYSFDGSKLRSNDSSSVKSSKFDLIAIENPNPNARGAAKSYFLVTENGKPSYLWDVRWKGSPAFGSPQIQTMRVKEGTKKVFIPFQE